MDTLPFPSLISNPINSEYMEHVCQHAVNIRHACDTIVPMIKSQKESNSQPRVSVSLSGGSCERKRGLLRPKDSSQGPGETQRSAQDTRGQHIHQ